MTPIYGGNCYRLWSESLLYSEESEDKKNERGDLNSYKL